MLRIDEQKRIVRKQIKEAKKLMREEEYFSRSKRILSQVETLPQFREAATVMLYWSIVGEVFTHDFVQYWAKTKKIILPCVNSDTLLLRRFEGLQEMQAGESFSIPEPTGDIFRRTEEITFIIVPGVAFDKKNNRMGRGKAYYDKLLVSLEAFKLGICFDFQLLDEIPVGPYDIKMDRVVSG